MADPMDKTRHADDATLAYIAQLESQLAAANARLAGIVEECAMVCDQYRQTEWVSEYPHAITAAVNIANKIRAIAPAIAEKVYPEGDEYELTGPSYARRLVKKQPKDAAPIPQPADGVVVPEGCTVADAQMLRKANHELAESEYRLRQALRFYANEHHFDISGNPEAWDTVSGEPPNYWCDEAGTATIEDGTIAKMALRGERIDWEDEPPQPAEGEPEHEAALLAAAQEPRFLDSDELRRLENQQFNNKP